jgi:hypothetical protein
VGRLDPPACRAHRPAERAAAPNVGHLLQS